jgi:hypothetical protein
VNYNFPPPRMNYSTPPPSASAPSSGRNQRRLSYAPKTYQATTTRAVEPSSPPEIVEDLEPAAIKFQRTRDMSTPVTIKLFVDDTQVQRMLLPPSSSFKKLEGVVQVKCEKYFDRKIEIGKISYVDSNNDLVRLLEEDDWLECKYDLRKELFIRLDLIDVTDAGSNECLEEDIFAAYE